MIIMIIATALIQCTIRTQAGWITALWTVAVRSWFAVMLDMAVPPQFAPAYTPKNSVSLLCLESYPADFTNSSFRDIAIGPAQRAVRCRWTRNPEVVHGTGFRVRAKSAPRNDRSYDTGISTV